MRLAVLFIVLHAAKYTLASCAQTSTSSGSASTSSFSTTSFTSTTTTTATTTTTTETKSKDDDDDDDDDGDDDPFLPPPVVPGVLAAEFPDFLLALLPIAGAAVALGFAVAWHGSHNKANHTGSQFTLEEKVMIVTGLGYQGGLCSGNIPSVGGNFSGLCIQESALGVGQADFVTAFPAGINTAATWQYSLFRARGVAIGKEHLGKGVNVALTPMVNLGRVPNGGRNWEGFGADPFLVSAAAYETIIGVQAMGVQAVAKSFINNDQQTQRDQYNANVDDRTQHEIYAAPFLRSVMAGVASVMCSSNLVNGTYACENSQLLNNMLKIEFDFRGYVMSDWYATHSTDPTSGLDMTMPGDITPGSGTSYFGTTLLSAVKDGTVPESWLDGMLIRILGSWNFLGQNTSSFPATNFNSYQPFDAKTNEHIDVQADHDTLVRQIDAASAILLKNVDSALPLKNPRTLVLVGSDAGPAHVAGPNWFNNQAGVDGILAAGWGPGSVMFPYLVSPYEAIQARARVDQTTLSWFFDDFDLVGAGSAAIDQDAVIVFLQSDSGDESNTVDGNTGDRKNLTAWHNGDALVLAVAAQNKNTMVVVHSVGPLIIEPWIDNPNVTAVIWAGFGGTETGNGLVDVLYGAVNPSGRLPYTIAKSPSDYPATVETGTINYSEGLFIDYRHFDAANIAPRYEFGFGLSYTEFKYSDLSVVQNVYPDSPYTPFENAWLAGTPVSGHSTDLWLHRVAFNVTFTVQNTGAVAGTEITQVYLHFPVNAGEPPSVLRGFRDVELQPGKGQSVTITLSRYDLSYWDVVHQAWLRAMGTYSLSVGASSRDFRLNGNIPL